MIKYIKRKKVDIAKYNACIEQSQQSRVYAFSWYLDIVADNWDVLILDDYKAVMPIPWRKKYLLSYITQPVFCQQLGVFSLTKISKKEEQKFIKNIPTRFLKTSLNFNSDNHLNKKMVEMKNYILDLNTSYEIARKSFSKGRKHAVKVGEKTELTIRNTSILSLIKIQETFYNYTGFSKERLESLSKYVLDNNKGKVLGVFNGDVLVGGALFLQTKYRIVYLFSSFTDEGKKVQAASFLISDIIKQYENSNLILDFEGGNMPNIGSFFRSFGAREEQYYFFKRIFL